MDKYLTLYDRLSSLEDPRDSVHIVYTLPEVLFIIYASILSDYTTWEDMESFAINNSDWFRQFYPYQFGFPSHHTIRKVCILLDSESFMRLFVDWMSDIIADLNTRRTGPFPQKDSHVTPIDGKALRGSRPSKGQKMVQMVSAYNSELKLVLGFAAIDRKSNEITAIPQVLDMLTLEGALISSDAMGCQRDICQHIIDKKADYLLCVKDNQPILHENIESVFTEHIEQTSVDPGDSESFAETVEKKQGTT